MKTYNVRFTRAVALTLAMLMALTSTTFAAEDKASASTATIEEYTDLNQNTKYISDIEYVIENGIMDGEAPAEFQPDSSATRSDLVEALYRMDDSPVMLDEAEFTDVAPNTETADAVSWGQAYGIIQETTSGVFSPDAPLTREQAAILLYRYADHKDVNLDEPGEIDALSDANQIDSTARDAVAWAISKGIMTVDNSGFQPDNMVSRGELAEYLTNYDNATFEYVGVETNGMTLMYPSEAQRTICPLRDFYVVGDIEDNIEVPSDARLTVSVETKDGQLMREVYTEIKDNQNGMYVDYPEITISGDREAFRASLMPDLVYDPQNPESFKDTWNKAYYTDEHFTSVIYGGSYHQDINPIDQFGQELKPLPEGDYQLNVELESEGTTLASLTTQITIGVDANKVLARFSPSIHMEKVKDYAQKHNYMIYLDPFPGYWDTATAMPEWGLNFNGQIRKRWALADRECYIGGMTHFFDYNITPTSTSYSVEIGQLGYDKALTDPSSISYCYYDIGEPVITQHGKTYEGTFVEKNLTNMDSLEFTRVDRSSTAGEENYLDSTILSNANSVFDLMHNFTVQPGETLALNGVCKVIQPDTVTFNPDMESFTMGNKIASVTYTIKTAAGEEVAVIEKEVPGLTRKFDDGWVNTSILEFRHNISITEEMRGNTYRIFAQAKDEYGRDTEGSQYACMFTVPR